jgi:hypothetical protein
VLSVKVDGAAAAMPTPAFPLRNSANGRYLEDQDGTPVPILGRTAWFVLSLPVRDYTTFLEDTVSRGYDAIELHVLNHDPRGNAPPRNGNGDLPFALRLDGAPWSGALTYADITREAPDLSTPNEAYWRFVDAFLATCEERGLLVLLFPAYVGYAGGDQGWMQEMVANGAPRLRQFGAFLAERYKDRKNLVWMMGGDMGTFSASQASVEDALIAGLKSVGGQASTAFSAEWASNSVCTAQATFARHCTLQSVYSWTGEVLSYARKGYSRTPAIPTFLLEEPYDEEGPDGNGVNSSATQPVRRFQLWGWLSGIAGYVSGNGYVWPFRPGWQDHLDTQGTRDMARLNGLIRSLPWHELVPSELGGMRKLVTAGNGSVDGSNYIAAAAAPAGTLLVAYVPPTGSAGRSFAVDMAALKGTARARWWNPATGTYTTIADSLPATGSRAFSTPGDNGTGHNDWVLVVDAAPAAAGTLPDGGQGASAGASGGCSTVDGLLTLGTALLALTALVRGGRRSRSRP